MMTLESIVSRVYRLSRSGDRKKMYLGVESACLNLIAVNNDDITRKDVTYLIPNRQTNTHYTFTMGLPYTNMQATA